MLSAGLESLCDDLVVSSHDSLVLGDNILVELSVVNLASENSLVVNSGTGVVASLAAPLVRVAAGAGPGSLVASGDSLVRVAGLPGSAARPSVARLGPGISLGHVLTSVEFLDLSVAGRGESGESSSF